MRARWAFLPRPVVLCRSTTAIIRSATSVLEASAVGQVITRMASTSSLASTTSSATAYLSGPASPMMSTGLPWDHVGGSTASKADRVPSERFASVPPRSPKRSVARTPAPPPLVMMASLSPVSGGCRARISAALNSSSSSRTRRTPARRNAASYAPSAPARAPMWESAALAPLAFRPVFTTMTDLARAARRAAGLPIATRTRDRPTAVACGKSWR